MTFDVSAEVYDRHVGRYGPSLSREHAAAAQITPGERALDVGCGPGVLTRVLADLLGVEQVAAVDPSKSFVAACRARVPAVDVRTAAAESLPFEDAAFDVVLSQLVVNFLADRKAGLREMRRVARPGGRISAAVWDYSGGMTMLRAFWDAALELDPSAPDEGRTMECCRKGELAQLFEQAGLAEVEGGALEATADYEDFDDYWAPFPTGLAPSGAYCASLGPAEQEGLREACFRRLGSPAGPFTLTARAWYAIGFV
jgi:ubiquinone/menaquinone biosynthesis C-methylase UbiE